MNFKLFKVPYHYTDKKGVDRIRYNFYLVVESGSIFRINNERYQDSKDNWHDNYDILCVCATTAEKYEDIKY